ncbi:PREDICTED: centromere-associated protein E isoform X2 [Nelumbo nucifera]|uniref:Centromere-associated protein E isoform X2 n=1 Tax=Nelumbo nucifera TaxID=4432 RepID=A0A1U8BBL9_NELNU|nr:PREDICTED: centromere-associated protein E isoform X2 [Nelumbo nucifera]
MQEAAGSGSNQYDGNDEKYLHDDESSEVGYVKVEHEIDGGVLETKYEGSGENLAMAVPDGEDTRKPIHGMGGISISTETTHKQEGTRASDLLLISEVQKEDLVAASSHKNNLGSLSASCDLVCEWKEGVQPDMERGMKMHEVNEQLAFPGGAGLHATKIHQKPLEVIGRDSDQGDVSNFIVLRGGSADVLESFKEEFYFTYVAKELLQLQLAEQIELQLEFDQHNCQLVDEVCRLNALLKETQKANLSLNNELVEYKSDIQAVRVEEKEQFETQLFTARGGIEETASRAHDLQAKLERSQEDYGVLLAELDELKSLVASLQKENTNLNGSVTSLKEENEKLQEGKMHVVHENEKLSADLVDHQEQLVKERGKYMQLEVDLKEAIARLEQVTVENTNLNGSLMSLMEEKNKYEEEKGYFSHDNEKLLAMLADHREQLDKESGKYLQLEVDHEEAIVHLEQLTVENANLNGSLTSLTEKNKKLEQEKGYFAHEHEKFLAELALYQDQLAKECGKYKQLEVDHKEAIGRLEQLTEENVFLSSSLEMHKAKTKEINAMQPISQAGERRNRLDSSDMLSMGHYNSTLDETSQQIQEKCDGEIASGVMGKSADLSIMEKEVVDVSVGTIELMDHLKLVEEAEGIIMQLEKAIEGLHSQSTSLSRSGGIASSAGVSKLIQAFELKVHQDDSEPEEVPLLEGERSAPDPFQLAKVQIGHMRDVLKELNLNFIKVDELFKEEQNNKKLSAVAYKELKALYEASTQQSNNLGTKNSELKVLCNALKQQVGDLEAKNSELVDKLTVYQSRICHLQNQLHEIQRSSDETAATMFSQVVNLENVVDEKLAVYQSRIGDLQSQLHEVKQSLDEMAAMMFSQVENLQKEVDEKASIVDQEWNSIVAVIYKTVEELDASIGRFCPPHGSMFLSDGFDVDSRISASVNAAIKVIEDLHMKLQSACTDHEVTRCLHEELSEKFSDLHRRNELAVVLLNRIYGDLRELINASHGDVEENDMDMNDVILLDPLQPNHYEALIEQLGKLLDERLQLENAKSELELELTKRTQEVEDMNKSNLIEQLGKLLDERLQLENAKNELELELTKRTQELEDMNKSNLDTKAVLELVEDVEGIIKAEAREIDSDKSPVSLLGSSIAVLIQKYRQASEQVSLSKDSFESKVTELNELKGRMLEISSLNLQQEDEIHLLKGSLSKTEEALQAVCTDLQAKVTELEQSEQRVSSLREKLSIAVAKGKGLITQRDGLKQSLAETSSELERCSQELQLKDTRLHEAEIKLKAYSEAGERVEALESELSYIRNSATALRESFLVKDSILQRIEELLEDLDLPEHFHSRDIIEKIEWLVRSVMGNSLPLADWDQKSSVGGGSYSDAGFVVMDAWKEDVQQSSNPADELRIKYEELQNKFYGLAEQNEMLEQSLMERNNLVQRWEEILDRINMPLQLRSMEPEDRIEWLGGALSEVYQDKDLLQRKIGNLESHCGSVTADLEELQRKISELEVTLQAVTHEKGLLSENLEILTLELENVSKKATQYELEKYNLMNELTGLQEKLVQKLEIEEYHRHMEDEIRRLQVLISDVLQDYGTEHMVPGSSNTECLEGFLRKLIDNYRALSMDKSALEGTVKEIVPKEVDASNYERRGKDVLDSAELNMTVYKKELEEALSNLSHVKEERDKTMEKLQSLISEVDVLNAQRDDLKERLNQEEQKLISTREKLNVAVRKGKGLVQQRDSLKQTIEAMNTEMEHLKSELNHRGDVLVHYEQRIKELSAYAEKVQTLESESLFLRNRLSETEHNLEDSNRTLNRLLNTLHGISVEGDFSVIDPVQKLEGIGKLYHDLHAALASTEHEAKKSKRATELLLAELNEVNERADGLHEELAKAEAFLAEVSKERDVMVSQRDEALSHLEKLITLHSEERKNQYSEAMELKAAIDQLRNGCFGVKKLVEDVLIKELGLLNDVDASMSTLLKQMNSNNVLFSPLKSSHGFLSSNSMEEGKFPTTGTFSEMKMQDHFDESIINEVLHHVGNGLRECNREIDSLKEKIHKHSISADQQAVSLSKVMETLHGEIVSQKESLEHLKKDVTCSELMKKGQDTEIFVMRRGVALLYEAFTTSIFEIENQKTQMVGNVLESKVNVLANMGMDLKLPTYINGRDPVDEQVLVTTEECIKKIAESLLTAVRGLTSMLEDRQKDLKSTIFNLQKELQEKDIQSNMVCGELVSQIKEAEAVARRYSLDLESAKDQVHKLEKQLEMLEEQRNLLELRIKELRHEEASSMELQERNKLLADKLTSKEQENEALMQALDEEELQMEELTKRIEELEKVVQQKNLDLENLEASHAKAMENLSITVTKFDDLHHLFKSLLSEVESLQSQLQGRDAEISFLRQENTKLTDNLLASSHNKKNSDEINEVMTWLDMIISRLGVHDLHLGDSDCNRMHAYKDIIDKQITSIMSESENLRVMAQSKEALLQEEKSRIEELLHKEETLERSLQEKETQLALLQGSGVSGPSNNMTTTEILEVEPFINKRTVTGASHVRSLRKVNNDQVAIGIDMDPADGVLNDEDDDKVHGFKSLSTSKIVPRFTRPVTDMIDGLWVSCDRALMRQPALRLGIIIYWAVMHTLLATFIV